MTIGSLSGSNSYYGYQYMNPLRQPRTASVSGQEPERQYGTIPLSGDEEEKKSANPDEVKKPGKRSAPADCETCKNRKYQDGSNESNVSFKTASHISPNAAGAAVRAHEGEHVSNAYKKAAQNNGKVLNASVSIHTSVCPECGRVYVSGGTTNTTIKYSNEDNPYMQNQKKLDAMKYKGAHVDYVA